VNMRRLGSCDGIRRTPAGRPAGAGRPGDQQPSAGRRTGQGAVQGMLLRARRAGDRNLRGLAARIGVVPG